MPVFPSPPWGKINPKGKLFFRLISKNLGKSQVNRKGRTEDTVNRRNSIYQYKLWKKWVKMLTICGLNIYLYFQFTILYAFGSLNSEPSYSLLNFTRLTAMKVVLSVKMQITYTWWKADEDCPVDKPSFASTK